MSENDHPLALILKDRGIHLIGQNILYYPRVSSTMDAARRMADAGITEGTVILADEQTAGRGRLGRQWLSSPGSSLLLSIILRPSLAKLPQLNMVGGLAALLSIERATGLKPAIKWPNDVLIKGKKVSGILMENVFEGGQLKSAIVGVGMNIRLDVSSYAEISTTATSLMAEWGREMSRWEILLPLLEEFGRLYDELKSDGAVYEKWLSRVETLGKTVRIRSGDLVEEGYAESINADGSLTLKRYDGSLATIVTGE